MTNDDFDGLLAILHVLKPLSLAQKALEGDQYENISLVPLAVHHLRIQLEECQAIADPITERDLSILIDKMLEDFHSRWREASYYTTTTVRAASNRKVGIPTYSYWAIVLDPRTKKYIGRVLPHAICRERLWKDVESACVEIARIDSQSIETEPQHQEAELSESQRKRKKNGAASFFISPNSDEDEEAENESIREEAIEAIVANEIRKYQVDNGLKLERDGSYNRPLKWWNLNHSKYPSIWKLAERILSIPATSAPAEHVFSSAANIVNKKRINLKPENVDLLVFMMGNKEFVSWEQLFINYLDQP